MNHAKLSSDAAGGKSSPANCLLDVLTQKYMSVILLISQKLKAIFSQIRKYFDSKILLDERGDVPGWVLVVLMTTGLVTAIWTIAAPRLTAILRNSLDAMNGIR